MPLDLPAAALRRQLLTLRIHPPGSDPFDLQSLPLWPEAEYAPGRPHERDDVWRVLAVDPLGRWRATVVDAGDCELLAVGEEIPPITLAAGLVPEVPPHTTMETLAVCARFGLRVSFDVLTEKARKAGASEAQTRRGVPVGFKVNLVFIRDADRLDAMRGFARDGISRLSIDEGQALPIWLAHGYQMPGSAGFPW